MKALKKNCQTNTLQENITGSSSLADKTSSPPRINFFGVNSHPRNSKPFDPPPLSIGLTFSTGVCAAVVICALLFYELFDAGFASHLWADGFDGSLLYWIASWGHHALRTDPGAFFSANIFYPHANTFAYSDSLLSAQLFYTPYRLLGFSPLVALNATLLSSVVCGCVLTAFAARRLGIRSPAALFLLLFATHGSLSVTHFLGHYQLFGFHFAPSCLLYMVCYLQTYSTRDGITALLLFAFASCYAVYLAPMLSVLALCYVLLRGSVLLYSNGILTSLRCIGWRVPLAALFIGTLVFAVHFSTYYEVAAAFPTQDPFETAKYSANFRSLFTEISQSSYWYGFASAYAYGDHEHAYFPGTILLAALFLYALSILVRLAMHVRKKRSLASLFSPIELFTVSLLVGAYALSLGPFWKAHPEVKLPFHYASLIIPGVESMRAPGRFGMFLGMGLGIALLTCIQLAISNPRWRNIAFLFFSLALVIESIPQKHTIPFSIEEKLYSTIDAVTPPNAVVAELPVVGKDHFTTIQSVLRQMVGSTLHWRRLLVGYSAKFSAEHYTALDLDAKVFHATDDGDEQIARLLAFLQSHNVATLVLRLDAYPEATHESWQRHLMTIGAQELRYSRDTAPSLDATKALTAAPKLYSLPVRKDHVSSDQ